VTVALITYGQRPQVGYSVATYGYNITQDVSKGGNFPTATNYHESRLVVLVNRHHSLAVLGSVDTTARRPHTVGNAEMMSWVSQGQ
ncbi:MAG: hypothetical protein LC748_11265, partial [Thermomicrobia bacterium]|nr:hypothetical protein [Thermomicrobia bacterium]